LNAALVKQEGGSMKRFMSVVVCAVTVILVGCSSQAANDSAVTAKIKGKLATNSETSAIKIGVETNAGVVTLTGTVPTETEKGKAEQLAKNTDGVKSVTNKITVDTSSTGATNLGGKAGEALKDAGASISDAAILTKVKAKLLADGITGTNVDVSEGKVVLKGEVEDAQKKAKAEELARKTDGVKDVKNKLAIKKTAA
jgi:hyperosmotically inducible periplasmic protein